MTFSLAYWAFAILVCSSPFSHVYFSSAALDFIELKIKISCIPVIPIPRFFQKMSSLLLGFVCLISSKRVDYNIHAKLFLVHEICSLHVTMTVRKRPI